MTDKILYAVIRLSSLPRVLWRAAFRRPIVILGVDPSPLAERLWTAVGNWLVRRGRACQIGAEGHVKTPFSGWYLDCPDMFSSIETDYSARFGLDRAVAAAPRYAVALRHAAAKYVDEQLTIANAFHRLAARRPREVATVIGVDPFAVEFHRQYFKAAPGVDVRTRPSCYLLANFGISIVVAAAVLRHVAARLTIDKPRRERFDLAYDFVADPISRLLVDEICDQSSSTLAVFRNRAIQRQFGATVPRGCIASDGAFSAVQAWRTLADAAGDGLRLARVCRAWPPALFGAALKLVFHRVKVRGFLNKYDLRRFWSRDDYNAEHAVRTAELRDRGVRSYGINHGVPTPEIISPAWRYLDYDVYFVFGRYLYDHFYRETWSPRMTVRPVGSYRMTRAQLARLGRPRPRDVVYFPAEESDRETVLREVLKIARAFPDRAFYVKPKRLDGAERGRTYPGGGPYCQATLGADETVPPNMIETHRDAFELMLETSIALTGGSTVTLESIQFGLAVFLIDSLPQNKPFLYRLFPGLCYRRAEDVIDRIRALDAGVWRFPRETFGELVDLSGRVVFDVLREEMGFAPKDVPGILTAPQRPPIPSNKRAAGVD